MAYNSMRFVDQLNKFIEAFPELDYSKQRSEDHVIDLQRRNVIRIQKKKYKFQANKPFDLLKSSVQFCNVRVPI